MTEPDPCDRPWEGHPLGGYTLDRLLGSGGMGEVWAATHLASGMRVAIKLLGGLSSRNPHFLAAFRSEIRATAGLDHPCIVRVWDRGEVPAGTEEATSGRIPRDSPYLVMEYVGGGSLASWCGRLVWKEIRRVLVHLLDALAHAHARGLVHRDIKPENVLLPEDHARVKLTDFGLAHAMERAAPSERERGLVGTPRYMAPEQCRGDWRDYGPWTDLYSLGCLGYALASGRPPFAEISSHWELVRAQSTLPPPPLVATRPVPQGFEDWLLALMAKDPAARPQRASEAASALARLDRAACEATVSATRSSEDDVATDPAIPQEVTALLDGAASDPLVTLLGGDGTVPSVTLDTLEEAGITLDSVSRIPPDWRPAADPQRGVPLVGTGLAVYWLRSIPVVGREAERDLLWAALRRAEEGRRLEVVVLDGPAGSGKSRLLRWICERGHEIGGVTSLFVEHGADPSERDGVPHALARMFRVAGQPRHEVLARLGLLLGRDGVTDPDEIEGLAGLLCSGPSPLSDPEATAFPVPTTRDERLGLLRRCLSRLVRQRPLVLAIDDVQHGARALELVRHLQEGGAGAGPVLVALAARKDELAGTSERELLGEVLAAEGARRVDLGPLDPSATEQLVRRLLHLEGDLALQVEERSQGNPAFALQLVGSWVDRGILEPGESGFRLRKGATAEIPDGLHAVWAGRVEQFLWDRSVHDGPALELAAALGQDVDSAEWWDACLAAGLAPSLDLVDRLLDEGLATCGHGGPEEGWSFVQAMLRESLERRAAEAGRLREQHAICAQILGGRQGPGTSERLGRHLVAAGRHEDALVPLLAGARERLAAQELRWADGLLSDYERTLHELRVPWDDPRWGRGWMLRVQGAVLRGDDGSFAEWADRTRAYAQVHGWAEVGLELELEEARLARRAGRLEDAATALRTVESESAGLGAGGIEAACVFELAQVAEAGGNRHEAAHLFQRATGLYKARKDDVAAGRGLLAQARIKAREGDPLRARALLDQAAELFARWGNRAGRAGCSELAGLIAQVEGETSAAVERYREAAARYDALGSVEARRVRASLGQALAWELRTGEATDLLLDSLDWFGVHAEGPVVAAIHAALLPCLAAVYRWPLFDDHLLAALALARDLALADEDVARSAGIAAEMARDAGQPERARAAWGLALTVLENAGLGARAAKVRRELAAL